MMRAAFALILALLTGSASAACLPAQLQGGTGSPMVVSYNKAGAWAGWWCPGASQPYVAAVTTKYLTNVAMQRTVAMWLMFPSAGDLVFGADPFTDPVLLKIWTPYREKIDAMRPS